MGGRSVMSQQLDIQLSGLGIQDEHCVITIEDGGLFMESINNARCFINGSAVTAKTPLHHGDRILWGNHHFFRVNCPKSATTGVHLTSEPQTPAQPLDYEFAKEELMQNELINDPIQSAIERLEKQHEEDKQVALEKQRQVNTFRFVMHCGVMLNFTAILKTGIRTTVPTVKKHFIANDSIRTIRSIRPTAIG